MKTKINEFWNKIPPHGQSLVELALFFPIILVMLSGLIEFGFLLNDYLNLMDGPREGARLAVDISPFVNGDDEQANDDFYKNIALQVTNSINPYVLDNTTDDVVISAYAIRYNIVTKTYPTGAAAAKNGPGPDDIHWYGGYYTLFNNFSPKVTETTIQSKLSDITYSGDAVLSKPDLRNGLVAVEMFYAYKQKLALPWITVFVPDPIHLHMYAISPLPGGAPPKCPDPLNVDCPVVP
jgi:Flp pilus assembly protein TadG